LAYSASNTTVFPSVLYTGRQSGDPAGQMTLGENSIIAGTGSQTGGGNRWGDYTALSVDPTDDLTFWYVNEYVPTTSASGWRLRIGSFRALPGGASPTPPSSPTPSPTPPTCANYTFTPGTGTIVPGTVDTGNHTDDGDTTVSLPFSFQLYGQTFTTVQVSSNGRLDFVTGNEPGGFVTACLPAPPNIGPYDFTIFPVWEDMRTDSQAGCASFPGGQCGIFTSVSGTAPNRVFNIEWRTVLFANTSATQNFEARLFENDPNKRFDVIIGALNTSG